MSLKICVVGAGAIGSLLAYRLGTRGGQTVSVVARGAQLDAIRSRGLTLREGPDGALLAPLALPVTSLPADLGTQDVVILALKAHALADILPQLAPLLGPETRVVPAINGVPFWYFYGQPTFASWVPPSLDRSGQGFSALSPERIVGCVVHAAAEVTAPGVVTHTAGWRFMLGEIDSVGGAQPPAVIEPGPRLAPLAAAMQAAGFEANCCSDIRYEVWWKLLGNLSFNPIAALYGLRMQEICNNDEVCAVIRPLISEAMRVAAGLGMTIPGTPDQRIDVARKLGNAKISMHQDLEAGRKLELDAIVKAVIDIADRLGVAVPTIRLVDERITQLAVSRGLYP